MRLINLIDKIANGEEVPKKIKYRNHIFEYEDYDYFASDYGYLFDKYNVPGMLNDEVEIIENTSKEETTVSEEQILFNNLTSIDQDYVIRIMKMLQQPIDYLKSKGDE